MPPTTKMTDVVRKYEHKNFAREKCKSEFALLQFLYLCAKYWQIIYAKDQDSLSNFEFTARVYKNQLHFMVKKSNFGEGLICI